jgi:hypothetical protein
LIERNEVETYKNDYKVISDKLVAGKPLIHILSEHDPGNGFEHTEASIEDVFFSKINSTEESVLNL